MRASLLLAGLVVAGCDVGQVTVPAPNQAGGPDATAALADAPPSLPGSPDAAPAAGSPDAAPVAAFQCRKGVTATASGQHNAGTDCMSGNCHGPGGGGPQWTVAGTLYSSAGGGAIIAGATVTVIDANGATLDLVTAQNGNFWTGQTVALPAKIYASQCPTVAQMSATISNGSCNTSGCHASGSTTGRVHLP